MTDDARPDVTVIIPCYNTEEFVREAIESALAQTHVSKEVIVVNDGSTDGSDAIIREYLQGIRYISQNNAGLAGARNRGVEEARGEWLAFLDADDYWEPTFIEKMHRAGIGAGADLVYCGWQHTGNHRDQKPFIPPDYECMDNKVELMIQSARWPVHAVMVRASVVKQYGGFNGKYGTCEDFGLWIHVATRHRLVRVTEVLAYYRHHGAQQMTSNFGRIAVNHWRIQQEYLRNNPDMRRRLGSGTIQRITTGELKSKGYAAYWRRDLRSARSIFRQVMKTGRFGFVDLKYMIPCLLPYRIQTGLLQKYG